MQNSFSSKPLKSSTTAILLTIFFGPFGLFYASIFGGFVMILGIPILVLLLLVISTYSSVAFGFTIFWGICFLVLYWPICIIWASISVDKHNRRIHQKELQNQLYNQNSILAQLKNSSGANENSSILIKRQQLQNELDRYKIALTNQEISEMEFLLKKEKLEKQIDVLDHNMNTSEHPKEPIKETIEYQSDNKSYFWIVLLILLLTLSLLYLGSTKGWLFDRHSKDRVAIKEQIEKTYFGLLNGGYTSETLKGVGPDGLPFYNQTLEDIYAMSLFPLANILGIHVSIDPKNIEIYDFINDNSAKVKYDLIVQNGDIRDSVRIDLIAKKISGYWKLDGEKALGFSNAAKKEKKVSKVEKKITFKEDDSKISNEELTNSKNSAWKIISYKYNSDLKPRETDNQYLLFINSKIYLIIDGKIEKLWHVTKEYLSDEYAITKTKEGDEFSQLGNITISAPNNSSIEYDGYSIPIKDVVIDNSFIR
jgi:hypothetical protein